jgi:hypothetical protein
MKVEKIPQEKRETTKIIPAEQNPKKKKKKSET